MYFGLDGDAINAMQTVQNKSNQLFYGSEINREIHSRTVIKSSFIIVRVSGIWWFR